MEIWKDIVGYEGRYQISNKGNVKSFIKNPNGHILCGSSIGYPSVSLADGNGNHKTHRIHVLVATHFIGEIPQGYQVHHKDGNKQNNNVDNLQILSASEHLVETLKMNPNLYKAMNDRNKYKNPKRLYQYTPDGFLVAMYSNSQIASAYTGICYRNILQVANKQEGRTQAGGFIWSFEEREGVVL